jgi:transglutaminase-like putative cysteine protease
VTAGSVSRQPAGELRPRDWDRGFDEPGVLGSALERLRPDEGWLSLVLVLVLAGTMAWSIADARWILGRDDLTSFVIWMGLAGALWGYISSRLEIAPWIAQVTGAAVGAFVLIEVVGSVIAGGDAGLSAWFQTTASSVTQAYLDLTWRHQISTTQFGHFCLIIGLVVWGTAQAASYDVFGYHRAINGVLLMAVVLLANMALTAQDQFQGLVLFSAAGLGLLLRAHAADERTSLQRHRIWRGGDLNAPRAQGGLGFASAAICGALILTTVASSAPLANAWSDVGGNFRDFATWFSAYLPAGNQSRITQGADFGSSTVIGSSFHASGDIVLTIDMPQGSISHWRVISYDNFKSTGWSTSGGSQSLLQPDAGLNDGTLDQVDKDTSGRTTVTYVVHVRDTSLKHLVVANEPGSASIPVTRVLVGSAPEDSDVVWFPADAASYTVTAVVPDMDPTGAGLTEWRLRQAGTDYPASLLDRYTQGAGLVGAYGQDMLTTIESWAATQGVALDPSSGHFTNAYDAAKAIQEYMRDPNNFIYDSNVSDLVSKCASLTTVDCFVRYRRGFCEQYATTMTMLMRMEGFPARYVEGFLSGHVNEASRAIEVTGRQRHAWVEVYFPGYGWIPFDPTGGAVGVPTELPAGSPAAASPTPEPAAPSSSLATRRGPTPYEGGSTPSGQTGGGPTGLLLPAVIGLVALLGLLVMLRRRPHRLESPDGVYRGIVRAASRLGYKPLPTQTVYEYTGMLADVVPRARDPLGEVATAQVEVAYGRKNLPAARLISLAAAQRVVYRALLRLVFRIPGRGPRRPRKGNELRRPD